MKELLPLLQITVLPVMEGLAGDEHPPKNKLLLMIPALLA
jgi:hypothetical protein